MADNGFARCDKMVEDFIAHILPGSHMRKAALRLRANPTVEEVQWVKKQVMLQLHDDKVANAVQQWALQHRREVSPEDSVCPKWLFV